MELSTLIRILPLPAMPTKSSPDRKLVATARPSRGDADPAASSGATAADVAQDDADIRASLEGDGQAYNRLVRRYQQPVSSYMWRFTRDRREWEELVQDVFVEAYVSLGSYRQRAPLLHWLKRIATRVGYRHWKRREQGRQEAPRPSGVEPLAPHEELSANEAAEIVHRLLAELAPRDRLAITLSYLEERSVAEIAELTGWSKSMVKVQLHRARKRLAKICAQQGVEL